MAESYGAISDMVCAVINESSRTALECALRCECRAKNTLNLYKRGFKIYDLLVFIFFFRCFLCDQTQTAPRPY